VLGSFLTLSDASAFPGWPTVIPTMGAALVIAVGRRSHGRGGSFGWAPVQWIGDHSYSIYLWHWPILVAAQAEYPDLRVRWTMLLMILSIIPAWLCHRYIENPVRFGTFFKPTGRALAMGTTLTALGVCTGLLLNASVGLSSHLKEASVKDSPGAAALLDPAGGR
jgi:peptidoglycan/LPS O-acetylase OafA/YrhL